MYPENPLVPVIIRVKSEVLTNLINSGSCSQHEAHIIEQAFQNGFQNVYNAVLPYIGANGQLDVGTLRSIIHNVIVKKLQHMRTPQPTYNMGGMIPVTGGYNNMVPPGFSGDSPMYTAPPGMGMIPYPSNQLGGLNSGGIAPMGTSVFHMAGDDGTPPSVPQQPTIPVQSQAASHPSPTPPVAPTKERQIMMIEKKSDATDAMPELHAVIDPKTNVELATIASAVIPLTMPGPNAAAEALQSIYPEIVITTKPVFFYVQYPMVSSMAVPLDKAKVAMKEIGPLLTNPSLPIVEQIKELRTALSTKVTAFSLFVERHIVDRVNEALRLGIADIATDAHPNLLSLSIDSFGGMIEIIDASEIHSLASLSGDFVSFKNRCAAIMKNAIASIAKITLLDPKVGKSAYRYRAALALEPGSLPTSTKLLNEFDKLIDINCGTEPRKTALGQITDTCEYTFYMEPQAMVWTNYVPHELFTTMGIHLLSNITDPEKQYVEPDSRFGATLYPMLTEYTPVAPTRVVVRVSDDTNIHVLTGLTANNVIVASTPSSVK